jgi:carboxyl-terminal processing protease
MTGIRCAAELRNHQMWSPFLPDPNGQTLVCGSLRTMRLSRIWSEVSYSMRTRVTFRIFAVFLCAFATVRVADAAVDEPTATNSKPADDPEIVLQQALDLERGRDWSAALRIYEQAISQWPARVEFRHRMRLCESHYRLARRYNDPSFREVLLRLSINQALDLYDEVLERIESHYVEPVSFVPLLRRGLDNMEVALRDPLFLDANAPNAEIGRVRSLRREFQEKREHLSARSRSQARDLVANACRTGQSQLNLSGTSLVFEFIFGACDALDDYSCYLTPNKLDDLYAVIDGNFVGLGVELKQDPAGLLLVAVIPGGPAAEAGLRAGERVTHINAKSIAGQGLDESASRLQGSEGTVVDLTILDKLSKPRSVRLTRRPVEVLSVSQSRLVDPANGIGYIQLNGFQKTSTLELQRSIGQLQRQGMRYLVLDLRGNPGGLLDVAVELADEFLDDGVIVSTRGRADNQNALYRARPGTSWRLPMAVLVDHDSASASEILAGALKDNRRALIMGEQSYGKGSVQSIFPLRAAPAGLKLTTAKFYSPLDVSYSEHGVLPDVTVRSAAKPSADKLAIGAGTSPDQEADPVLERAITQARRSLAVSRN